MNSGMRVKVEPISGRGLMITAGPVIEPSYGFTILVMTFVRLTHSDYCLRWAGHWNGATFHGTFQWSAGGQTTAHWSSLTPIRGALNRLPTWQAWSVSVNRGCRGTVTRCASGMHAAKPT